MQFNHTWQKVLSGEKTQTRRISLPHADGTGEFDCEMIGYPDGVMSVQRLKKHGDRWRTIYQIGKTYAVQPGRTAKGIARIRITGIRCEDVREINREDVEAEGFASRYAFWSVWTKMHDPAMVKGDYLYAMLMTERPAERYAAWALTFELVKK